MSSASTYLPTLSTAVIRCNYTKKFLFIIWKAVIADFGDALLAILNAVLLDSINSGNFSFVVLDQSIVKCMGTFLNLILCYSYLI